MAKILIIGGGVAGLSAGIYALLNGHRATVCERHAIAGGNLTGWQRGDYHIDNCIHWLTGTNPNTKTYKMWQDLGALGQTELYQAQSLYTCESDGKRLSLFNDLQKVKDQLLSLSPHDRREIERFINAVETLQELLGIAEQKGEKGRIKRLLRTPALLRYLSLSTGEFAELFLHPLIKRFFSCLLGTHFTALALVTVFATFCGGNGALPQGGSLAMAKRMSERFISLGGQLLTHKNAVKIYVKGNRATSVTFSDGSNLRADYIISAIDPKILFGRLLKKPLPKQYAKQYADKNMPRFSSYHCAFACDTDRLPFEGDLIFPLLPKERELLGSEYLILREFTHEKQFAPKGKTVVQSLTFCGEKRAKEFILLRQNKAAYLQKKQEIAHTVLQIIDRKFPRVAKKLTLLDVWTPATYERFTGAETGSYMSFILPKNKLPLPLSHKVRGIKNLVLATQWQQAPGGLPTAATLGKTAAEYVAKLERSSPKSAKAARLRKRKPLPVK